MSWDAAARQTGHGLPSRVQSAASGPEPGPALCLAGRLRPGRPAAGLGPKRRPKTGLSREEREILSHAQQ